MGVVPASGVGNLISGSTAGGGHRTPLDCASRLLRFSGGAAWAWGSPEPDVVVPGEPEGDKGEHGAVPGEPGGLSCAIAGAISDATATTVNESIRMACEIVMPGQQTGLRPVPSMNAHLETK